MEAEGDVVYGHQGAHGVVVAEGWGWEVGKVAGLCGRERDEVGSTAGRLAGGHAAYGHKDALRDLVAEGGVWEDDKLAGLGVRERDDVGSTAGRLAEGHSAYGHLGALVILVPAGVVVKMTSSVDLESVNEVLSGATQGR